MAAPKSSPKDPGQVLIIGAGPAGCSAASILAEQGHQVLVLEREKFPRYHVGESLLPFTYHPLRRLGLIERMRQSHFIKKYSVQFVAPSGKVSQPFYFSSRYEPNIAQTWQILRSEFDQMLMENARVKGARVLEEITVTGLIHEQDRVAGARARDKEGRETEYRAAITLDCSGKDAFAAVRNQWRVRDPKLNKIAVWTYYQGALRDPGLDAGATTVAFVTERGWFWFIPQHNDMTSVGVVAEGKYLSRDGVKAPEGMFQREVKENAWIKEHLAPGRQTGPYYITNEFSFHAKYCATEGLLLVGDAFAFLDPVFSSGLMLALKSGVMAADAVHEGLIAGDLSPARFTEYGRVLREGLENMRKLVYAFYDPKFSFGVLTEKHPELAGDLTDCLSGDINKDFTRLFEAVAEFVEVPSELPCGMPDLKDGTLRSRPTVFTE